MFHNLSKYLVLYFRTPLVSYLLCDLFLEHEDCCFTNYANGTTPYVGANNATEVIGNLTIITQKLFTWFHNNQTKVNHDKCHLLLSAQEEANIQNVDTTIKCSKSKKNYWEMFVIINLNLTNMLRTIAKKQAKN